jgi:hypothetical protein
LVELHSMLVLAVTDSAMMVVQALLALPAEAEAKVATALAMVLAALAALRALAALAALAVEAVLA